MRVLLLLSLLLFVESCGSIQGKVYKFNGRVTSCRQMEVSECGIMLYNCVDGYTYQCLQDVRTPNQ